MIDTRTGFVITYFKSTKEGEKILEDLIKTLSKQNFYLILGSHSAEVPIEIQQLCDFYFYQDLNIIDDRRYSHGVAENNIIEIAFSHLKRKGIKWTYKACYDIIINDTSRFDDWINDYKYNYVTCNWGDNFLATHSFFANVDFILDNIDFYDNIEDMFKVNNVLENCWQKNIEDKGLKDQVYSYKDKQDFFGLYNQLDVLGYNYYSFQFWFEPTENRFYITNNGKVFEGEMRIFDYYSETVVYYDNNFKHDSGITMWIVPPCSYLLPKAKNGFYLEIYTPDLTIRKNILINDFEYKDPINKKLKTFRRSEVKFNEYCEFETLTSYGELDFDVSNVRNVIDIGANYGLSSMPFIRKSIKTYMVEADIDNVSILENAFGNDKKTKIIGKAVSDIDGEIDFYLDEGNSVVSSMFEINANGKIEDRIKITVPSITPNTLIEQYIDEDYIDLIKIDIEGGEYIFFNTITDNNIKKVNQFIIEFHNNDNYEVMSIIEKLTKNDFNYKLHNWGEYTDPFIVKNKMGVIHAFR